MIIFKKIFMLNWVSIQSIIISKNNYTYYKKYYNSLIFCNFIKNNNKDILLNYSYVKNMWYSPNNYKIFNKYIVKLKN